MTEYHIVCEYVNTFFNDTAKTVLWMSTPNPLLGNMKPNEMVFIGRTDKLIKFINVTLDENKL